MIDRLVLMFGGLVEAMGLLLFALLVFFVFAFTFAINLVKAVRARVAQRRTLDLLMGRDPDRNS